MLIGLPGLGYLALMVLDQPRLRRVGAGRTKDGGLWVGVEAQEQPRIPLFANRSNELEEQGADQLTALPVSPALSGVETTMERADDDERH